jgi:hypothetical protein
MMILTLSKKVTLDFGSNLYYLTSEIIHRSL